MNERYEIEIITNDNAAFADGLETELARILRDTADKIENGRIDFRINDINGNKCGDVWNIIE